MLRFPVGATVALAGRYYGHRGCAIALEEKPGFLGSPSQKGKHSETGASWLHQRQDTWELSVSCEVHPSPDLFHQLGWLL